MGVSKLGLTDSSGFDLFEGFDGDKHVFSPKVEAETRGTTAEQPRGGVDEVLESVSLEVEQVEECDLKQPVWINNLQL